MNFDLGESYSVILMSVRRGAPYRDSFEEDGMVILYEGHDVPRNQLGLNPKDTDQPATLPSGKLTENGKFFNAALAYKKGKSRAHLVRVYEKIRDGIWNYNGLFELVDAWPEHDGKRNVFRFKLTMTSEDRVKESPSTFKEHNRVIPSWVKQAVWKRDQGKCVQCGAIDHLHYDHDLPFSKGGTSLTPANIKLLCARHNLQKSGRLE